MWLHFFNKFTPNVKDFIFHDLLPSQKLIQLQDLVREHFGITLCEAYIFFPISYASIRNIPANIFYELAKHCPVHSSSYFNGKKLETFLRKSVPSIANQLREFFVRNNFSGCMPLCVDGKIVGFLFFGTCPGFWNRMLFKLFLKRNSAVITSTLRSSIAFHDLRSKVRDIELLAGSAKVFNMQFDLDSTLEVIMDLLEEVFHINQGVIFLLNEQEHVFESFMFRGIQLEKNLSVCFSESEYFFQTVIHAKLPLYISSISGEDQRMQSFFKTLGFHKNILGAPLMVHDKLIGCILVELNKEKFTQHNIHIDIFHSFAQQAASAIHNARLYNQMKHFNETLHIEVEKATNHLEELLRMKSEFLTVASHQLRTPISIVRGMLSMLVEDEENLDDKEKQRFIHQAYVGSNRLERIIHQLLVATELDGMSLPLQMQHISLFDFVHRIIKEFQSRAIKKHLVLDVQYLCKTVMMYTDPKRLHQALANIVENALDYTLEGGVYIHVQEQSSKFVISVYDTGIGIAQTETQKIFSKFYRGENVWGIQPNGSGLGLFIARRLIQALGGDIQALPRKDGQSGSVFILSIPMVQSDHIHQFDGGAPAFRHELLRKENDF